MTGSTGIFTERLTKIYLNQRGSLFRRVRTEVPAVIDLTMHVPRGQVTGLLGLNGAGKTTTIKMLSTLLLPTSGVASLDGLDLVRDGSKIRRRINLVAGGERMVYAQLTGRENLWYFGQLYDVPRADLNRRIDELIALVGLSDSADTTVERYSKGMRQRLQIARGLINEPRYLFLDEPTIGLDAPIARDMRQMISRMATEGRGVLLTSHYLQEVDELCAYVYLVHKGRLIAQGTPAELKTLAAQQRSVSVVFAQLPEGTASELHRLALETGAALETATSEEGIRVTLRHQSDMTARVATVVARSGAQLVRLESLEPSLESAVVALTRQAAGDD